MINPKNDGIDHINIYSQALTPLGKMLSNFYKYPVKTKDGDFLSVEGYWYWLSIEDCEEKEVLRKCYGYWAKKTGVEILKTKQSRFDDNFEHKILNAIWYKFKRNKELIISDYQTLPFEHYYNFGGKVVDVKDKYKWMISGIESMRNKILESSDQI